MGHGLNRFSRTVQSLGPPRERDGSTLQQAPNVRSAARRGGVGCGAWTTRIKAIGCFYLRDPLTRLSTMTIRQTKDLFPPIPGQQPAESPPVNQTHDASGPLESIDQGKTLGVARVKACRQKKWLNFFPATDQPVDIEKDELTKMRSLRPGGKPSRNG
jgi:hypothetical protein